MQQTAVTQNNEASISIDALCQKFKDRKATIGIIGLGYVGLPLACATCDAKFKTIGYDVDTSKIEKLDKGESYIGGVTDDRIAAFIKDDLFEATNDFSRLGEADALLICVPTPITKYRDPDLSYVTNTTEVIAKYLRPGQLVILESTTYPGTTRDVMVPILEKASGLKSGVDFYVAYSPEREDPGNPDYNTAAIPKVVGGDGKDALRLAQTMYDEFLTGYTVPVSSPETAEAVKLTENIFRSVNIALVNELKTIYHKMGIDVWEVIDAAATKPFGYMPFYPGPGLGGHCIPIDPFYLSWKAREYGISTRFIELAGEINIAMPAYVIRQLATALNDKFSKPLNGTKILLLGVAYKKNVEDLRESPAFEILNLLEKYNAEVTFHDPYVTEIPTLRAHPDLKGARSVDLTKEILQEQDAVIIVTDHDNVDYKFVTEHAQLIVDTRNATREVFEQYKDKIVKA